MTPRVQRCLKLLFLCTHVLFASDQPNNELHLKWYEPIQHMAYVAADGFYEIFSRETFSTLACVVPFYGLSRLIDKPIHQNFFCYNCKKNTHQMPFLFKFTHQAIIFALEGVTLFSLTYGYGNDPSLYYDGIGSLVCVLSLWGVKNLFKGLWKCEGGLRPYDEVFAPEKRAYGGCPSGHMALVSSMAAYWWRSRGTTWGLPFAILSILGAGGVINVNRHYVSQVIAGFGLGTIMGIAMSKGVDFLKSVCNDVECGLSYDGCPSMYCQYSY